tara:strand:+ start:1105 stop:2094 length:990 start_codon:yes stop_codon:yes gene_type:complete
MKYSVYLSFFIFCLSFNAKSQDIHFSNLSIASPYYSIASIGSSESILSVRSIYRNQWPVIGNAYNTIGFISDFRIETENGRFGIGLISSRDEAGELSLTRLQIDGAITYHQKIAKNSSLSAGVQGGVIQHSISSTNAQWQNQFNGKEFDSSIPSGETPLFQPFLNYSVGAGIQWEFNDLKFNNQSNSFSYSSFGFSIYHAIASTLEYNDSKKEYARFVISNKTIYVLKKNKSAIEPSAIYQQKGKEKEVVFGLMYRYIIKEGSKFTKTKSKLDIAFGSYIRFPNDAVIPTFDMNYGQFQFGISYDINFSRLYKASNKIGGIEFGLCFSL